MTNTDNAHSRAMPNEHAATATVNFDSVRTYMEVAAVFALITSGTYLYAQRAETPWIGPFIVLLYGVWIAGASLYQYLEYRTLLIKEDDPPRTRPAALGAARVWILWLVYGIVFREVSPLVSPTMAYAQSIADGRQSDAKLFFFHRQATEGKHNLATKRGRVAAIREASGPVAAWSDIAAISDQWKDPRAGRVLGRVAPTRQSLRR